MMGESGSRVDEMAPPDALEALTADSDTALVDVRTHAEWTFTGMPDLTGLGRDVLAVEWATFPGMAPNQRFFEELTELAGGRLPGRLFFLCRSGGRSMAAARHVAALADDQGKGIHCTNVAGGFEGDKDQHGHRGQVNGWKVCRLPWRQG